MLFFTKKNAEPLKIRHPKPTFKTLNMNGKLPPQGLNIAIQND